MSVNAHALLLNSSASAIEDALTSAPSSLKPSLSAADLDCPVYSDADTYFLEHFGFWVEGILQVTVAALGIVGNTIASVIISRKEMRNSFNLLLVSLACFDSTYLFGSILESFRKTFMMATNLHIALFPNLLYPLNQMAISASIFMTVAIAWERYIAVHYPLDYNQAMNDTNAMRKRLLKYVGPVCALAFAFNVVKFFEANVVYEEVWKEHNATAEDDEVVNGDAAASYVMTFEARLEVAELRTHPTYTAYHNWSRLLVLGVVPFVLLVFFNTKIYKDIVERRRRRLR